MNNVTTQVFGNICWFSNLTPRYYKPITFTKKYTDNQYEEYDNICAINVERIADIPCDYMGAMGVPIDFINYYNPDEFILLGGTNEKEMGGCRKKFYTKEEMPRPELRKNYNYQAVIKNADGSYRGVYARLLIKRK